LYKSWENAVLEDQNYNREYAEKNLEEDFADSFGIYFTLLAGGEVLLRTQEALATIQVDPENKNPLHAFECLFPARSRILHKVRKLLDPEGKPSSFSGLCELSSDGIQFASKLLKQKGFRWVAHNLFKSMHLVDPNNLEVREGLQKILELRAKESQNDTKKLAFFRELFSLKPNNQNALLKFSHQLVALNYSPLHFFGLEFKFDEVTPLIIASK